MGQGSGGRGRMGRGNMCVTGNNCEKGKGKGKSGQQEDEK